MRTKGYRNAELCEIFATTPEDDLLRDWRRLEASRMVMRNNCLYSHGEHYLIAVLDWPRGIALLRHPDAAHEVSVSTATHQSLASGALWQAGWTRVHVPCMSLSGWLEDNLAILSFKVQHARGKFNRARTSHMVEYWRNVICSEMTNYWRFHDLYYASGRMIPEQ